MTDDTPAPVPPAPARPMRSRWRLYYFGAIAALLAVCAALFLAPWFPHDRPDGAEPVAVVIEQGDSLSRAAQRLEEAGLVSSADRFTLLARLLGGGAAIRSGEYGFYPTDGWSQHLETLQSGRPITRTVTIPEGTPSVLVQERLMAATHLTGEIGVPEEGSVLPATYDYARGEPRAALLARMQDAMTRELDRLWPQRKAASPVTTQAEAVTLASIIEKETAKPEERRRIAGVYANRLRAGMPLQADPTVIYPVTRGRPLGRRILRSELDDSSNAYNTYARRGLPVGPIANPGRDSIAAALDPEAHDFLYFVADGTGGYIFARTLAEHNANVERWYALRRQRGEM